MKIQTFIVSEEQDRKRADIVSVDILKVSRTKLQKQGIFERLGSEDPLQLPGKTILRLGETWRVSCPENTPIPSDLQPWDFPLQVLQESETWAAIYKPAGVSVHPSASDFSQKTIVNALMNHFCENLAKGAPPSFKTGAEKKSAEKLVRPGIVHRLDKPTSGVLLVAKNDATLAFLQSRWSEVTKTYYAVVSGIPPRSGKIFAGIIRDPEDRQKMTVSDSARAKSATTYFWRERVDLSHNRSLLRVEIPTGRTHQIRVHLKHIGFSILGDDKYAGAKAERLFLHATRLEFPDPDLGRNTVVSAELPSDFLVLFGDSGQNH